MKVEVLQVVVRQRGESSEAVGVQPQILQIGEVSQPWNVATQFIVGEIPEEESWHCEVVQAGEYCKGYV